MKVQSSSSSLMGLVVAILLITTTTTTTKTTTLAFQYISNNKPTSFRINSALGSATKNDASRQKRVPTLSNWGEESGIKIGGLTISLMGDSGFGLTSTQTIPAGSVVVTVPSSVALTIETPRGGPDDYSVLDMCTDKGTFLDLPWYVQFAFYLYKLDNKSSTKQNLNLQPWLDSLPRSFDTPIHWKKEDRDELLQYQYMSEATDRQNDAWHSLYDKLMSCTAATDMSWDDFLWGCECARSRAFSGGYVGGPFNPLIYAFTLLLVTGYVGLNLGTLEQAANGAALVFCASVLRDFVLPKLLKTKKYVICPVIDMCNHKSLGTSAQVAYEFFGNAYSLATNGQVDTGNEVFISYGSRSNDQLLQFYGFVESDNPHDVYIMPPLREWDLTALEKACGNAFAPGRLGKLDRAGLLGKDVSDVMSDLPVDDGEAVGNPRGGVVLTRVAGIDPAVIQALRALVSTESEWHAAGEAVGNFAAEVSPANERRARLVARTAIELELAAKPTSLEEDEELLKRSMASKAGLSSEERLAILFRIEKKKLLKETIEKLR